MEKRDGSASGDDAGRPQVQDAETKAAMYGSPYLLRSHELVDFAHTLCQWFGAAPERYRQLLPMVETIYRAGERRGATVMLRACAEIHPPLLRPGLINKQGADDEVEEQVRGIRRANSRGLHG